MIWNMVSRLRFSHSWSDFFVRFGLCICFCVELLQRNTDLQTPMRHKKLSMNQLIIKFRIIEFHLKKKEKKKNNLWIALWKAQFHYQLKIKKKKPIKIAFSLINLTWTPLLEYIPASPVINHSYWQHLCRNRQVNPTWSLLPPNHLHIQTHI